MSLAFMSMDLLWRNALGAIPLAIVVAIICRCIRCRPSTRHALWLIVLASLLAPPLLPALDFSDDLGSARFFASLTAQDKSATSLATVAKPEAPVPTPRGEARSEGAKAPPAILNSTPASIAADDSKPATDPCPSAGQALDVSSSCDTIASDPDPCDLAVADSPAAQLPAASVSTAPDRSPPPLRTSASIPDSSTTERETLGSASLAAPVAGAQPTLTQAATSEWRNWVVRLLSVRDAIVRLAPIPSTLWLAGIAFIVVVMAVRVIRFRRVLHRAQPADSEIVDLVQDCADAIGLRSLPRVLVTTRNVSPLVWCGVKRTLVLPELLWQELDDTGRRAVLLHELAHLKRRDYWVCWLELAACTVYWWNPMAWWVRHRLRDEADYCCDAWVTAVLPESRTAYARALLTTRQHLNASRTDAPSLALGATSARSKRFARRLTMVMTERPTPRLSLCGSALALCLAAGAWLATPLWACPPEETPTPSKATVKASKPAKVRVPYAVVAPAAPSSVAGTAAIAPGAMSTYEQHMAHRSDGDPVAIAQAAPHAMAGGHGQAGDAMDDRISRLEQRMDRLTAHIEQLLAGGGLSGATAPSPRAARSPDAPPAPPAPVDQPSPRAPRGMSPNTSGGGVAFAAPAGQDGGETIIRFYALPADKAEALFEFMRREDIPVLVASRDGGIELHGTERQHAVFAAFIGMINPGSQQPAPGSGSMAPMAGQREQMARADAERRTAETRMRQAAQEMQRNQRQQAEQMQRNMEQQRRNAERQRDDARRQVEELMRRSEELRQKAQELQEKASSLDEGDEKSRIETESEQLEAQAEEVEALAEAHEADLEAHMEAFEAELDAQQEAMEAELEARQEALEADIEAQQEAMEAEIEAQLAAAEDAKAAAPKSGPR